MEYQRLARGVRQEIPVGDEARNLLADSLQKRSDEYGRRALRAIGLLGDRETMGLAIDILDTRNPAQRANVIEALESLQRRRRAIIEPLMRLWEEERTPATILDWQRLLSDEDPWVRECALFAAHASGEMKMENIATLSMMERILFLRRVPLFANLSPADLKQIAAIAQEETFSDGTQILEEGETGDVMFIIVSGDVRVTSQKNGKEVELARRTAGDSVGEMAIISREPRTATLTALGNVRTLCIDQKSFEALLRDRPDVSLAVIRLLSTRLREADQRLHREPNRD
jgi:HEAT repeat protein